MGTLPGVGGTGAAVEARYGYGYRETPAKTSKAERKGAKRRGRTTPLASVPAAPTLDELGFDSRRDAREADRES